MSRKPLSNSNNTLSLHFTAIRVANSLRVNVALDKKKGRLQTLEASDQTEYSEKYVLFLDVLGWEEKQGHPLLVV